MNEPIAVADALRLIELALADFDMATDGRWEIDPSNPECIAVERNDVYQYVLSVDPGAFSVVESENLRDEANAAFIVLARATMRPLLAYMHTQIDDAKGIIPNYWGEYPALLTLRDHYDAVRPGWRER